MKTVLPVFLRRVIALLALFVPALSHGDVLYDQMTNHSQAVSQSSWRPPEGFDGDEYVYDNFRLPSSSSVSEVWFVGTALPASFTVRFYTGFAANPDLQTSSTALAPNETSANYLRSDTFAAGSSGATPIAGSTLLQHHVVLPTPLFLTGNTGYWIRIVADGYFGWAQATHGRDTSHLTYVTGLNGFLRYGGDMAFQLRGTPAVVQTFTVAASAAPAAGGAVTGAGTYAIGANVTLTATPAAGRVFLNWSESGALVSTSPTYTFTAARNRTLKANFVLPAGGPYVITAAANPAGSGNVGGTGTYSAGQTVTLDASPQDGVQLVSWTENGVVVSTSATYSFVAGAHRNLQANITNPAQGHFISGLRVPANTGDVIGLGGSGWSSGNDSFNRGFFMNGTVVTMVATPPPGHHFARWLRDGLVAGTIPSLLHVVVEDKAITAVFEPDSPVLTLTVTPPSAGSVTGAGTYAHGASVTATATAAPGYEFAGWTLDGGLVSTSATYTQTLTDHRTLVASFVASNRLLSATAFPAASGSITGAGLVGTGTTATLVASPAADYAFLNWTENGLPVSTLQSDSFLVADNRTLVANFAPVPSFGPAAGAPGQWSVSWPASATGWTLQESDTLAAGGWSASSLPVTTLSGRNQVLLFPTATRRFYRLKQP